MNKFRRLEMQEITNMRKEEYKYFVGTTLKNALSYEPCEKITFKIRVKHMDGYLDIPCVRYSLITDDGQKYEGYKEKSEDGWFYIDSSISKSGFVYIQARACDENKCVIENIAPFNGSAGADVGNILRVTKTPEDYHGFWQRLKDEVEATAPEVLFCKKIEQENCPDFEMYDITAIKNYIRFLKKEHNLSVTLHINDDSGLAVANELVMFNIHDNSYCAYIKTYPDAWAHCIEKQEKVLNKCASGAFEGVCYAGVKEYVYPILRED